MTTFTHDRRRAGWGFALLSAASFGLSGPLARGLMDAGWSSAAAVAVRVLLAAVVLAPIALAQLRGRWNVLRRNASLIAAYGMLAIAGCQLAYFNAVAHMEVGVALLIEYTAPVAVVGWLWLRRGQRPTRLTVLGAVLGVGGLLLVLDVVSGAEVNVVGILWALGAMVGAAAYFVLSSREEEGLPGTVLAAGGLLLGGIALLLAGLLGILPFTTSAEPVVFAGFTVAWWLPVLALGVVTAALAYVSGIAATRRLGSRLASFAALTEVLMALTFSWLLIGEVPRGSQLLGGVLILVGVIAVRLGEPSGDHESESAPVTVHSSTSRPNPRAHSTASARGTIPEQEAAASPDGSLPASPSRRHCA
ncbi:EamA family transporter [Allokutzneria albata]|uniref:Threonine/homoserine efflux transporter RhtA n=1 Tax=Allokutzneria albata TaxID=211114 RepID=A0A1G9V1M6_ALLAB|nr:DMT family transporter [Allokutzneria albata]SDM66003.1 Threonine/homoserine efflux transporter RhtA [Allokutzneria albata]